MEPNSFFENPFAVGLALVVVAYVSWAFWALGRLRQIAPVELELCPVRRCQPIGWEKRMLADTLRRLTFDPRVKLPGEDCLELYFRSYRSWGPHIEKWHQAQGLKMAVEYRRLELLREQSK